MISKRRSNPVYVIQNEAARFYIGLSEDVGERLAKHNSSSRPPDFLPPLCQYRPEPGYQISDHSFIPNGRGLVLILVKASSSDKGTETRKSVLWDFRNDVGIVVGDRKMCSQQPYNSGNYFDGKFPDGYKGKGFCPLQIEPRDNHVRIGGDGVLDNKLLFRAPPPEEAR